MGDPATNPQPTVEAELARIQAEVTRLKAQAERLEALTLATAKKFSTPPPPEPPAAPPRPAPPTGKSPEPRAKPPEPAARTSPRPPASLAPAAPVEKVEPPRPTPAEKAPPRDTRETKAPPAERPAAAEKPSVADKPAAVEPPPRPAKPADSQIAAAPASTGPAAPAPPASDDPPRPASAFRYGKELFQKCGAFGFSVIVHCVLLVILSLWTLPGLIKVQLEELQAYTVTPEDELTQELSGQTTAATTLTTTAGVSSVGLAVGHSTALEGGGPPQFDQKVSQSVEGIEVNLNDVDVWSVPGEALITDVPIGAPGDPAQAVNGYQEALDRITQEILMMLLKNDVLVIWLFDQSESMKDDQQEIKERVYRVYEELGLTGETKGDRLLTAVASFGQGLAIHTEHPTADLDLIKAAIDKVPIDASGLENLCPAVGGVISNYHRFSLGGRRQIALIVVSDESGEPENNTLNLEMAIAAARESNCPVYILGRESVFGYPFVHMQWVHPQTGGVHWLPINRGPETALPEQLQTSGFQRRYDAHPSGFGSFDQSRLARETGGVCFLLPSPEVDLVERDDRKYALGAMRPYLPDLGPREQYVLERDGSILRATLWKVITDLNPYWQDRAQVIEMRLNFTADPGQFAAQVREEQRKAAIYVTYLDAAEKALKEIRPRRDQEPSPRWRANYDLLYAQVLAYKVRLFEYGAYLEAFINNPKRVPLTMPPDLTLGRWDIHHRAETVTGELTRGYIELSAQTFQDVIRDHAGTPWEARAQWELARGFGIELVEVYYSPPPKNPPPPTNVTIPIPKL